MLYGLYILVLTNYYINLKIKSALRKKNNYFSTVTHDGNYSAVVLWSSLFLPIFSQGLRFHWTVNCLELQEQPSYIREVEVALLRREEIKKLKVQS
jgi:hypothetical protein